MIPVEGHKNLYRDIDSNAILNCDDSEYHDYMLLKSKTLEEKREIDRIKDELQEIKSMLTAILENTYNK